MKYRNSYPKVVAFFGPDGVGKSTEARLLVSYLKSKKCKVRLIWIRGGHTFAFILSKIFVRLGYYRTIRVPSGLVYNVFDPKILLGLSSLWGFIEFASILPLILWKVYIPMLLGYTIIADRYVVDTIVYLNYWLGSAAHTVSNILLHFIPQGTVMIHLDAEINTLTSRLYDDTSTREFLVYQRMFYGRLATIFHAANIDTTNLSIEETFKKIIRIIDLNNISV